VKVTHFPVSAPDNDQASNTTELIKVENAIGQSQAAETRPSASPAFARMKTITPGKTSTSTAVIAVTDMCSHSFEQQMALMCLIWRRRAGASPELARQCGLRPDADGCRTDSASFPRTARKG
jgi:hypothetical protein